MLKLYIIYGRHLSSSHMRKYCPTANPIAVASLKDHQLVFQHRLEGACAIANVIPAKGQEVPVVIWELSEKDERYMDRIKGIGDGLFRKEQVDIEVDGKTLQALIYVMDPGPVGVPTDRYLRPMAEGYSEFGLPIKALNDAITQAYENTVTNGSSSLRPAQ